jgi:hypothetical protein
LIGSGLGLAFALWMANGVDLTRPFKYCESCSRTMEKHAEHAVDLALLPSVQRLAAGDEREKTALPAATSPLRLLLTLHGCPKCGSGFLDGEAKLALSYTTLDGVQRRGASWLCLSAKVAPQVVTWVRDQAA